MAATQLASTPVCLDWVYSNNSNVHLAKDRAWFTNYTPFKSFAVNLYGMGPEIPIAGIGTVELQTKRSPNLSGRRSHGILRLTNVLHAPSAFCNIIGGPICDNYSVMLGGKGDVSKGTIKDQDGRCVAYFDGQRRLFQVKLRSPPVGSHVLQHGDGTYYVINVVWPDSERQRWEEYQARAADVPQLGYTGEEKQWLKDKFGGEFHFLQSHGLSIYKDEDREEGRSILRAIMQEDADEDKGEDESDGDLEGHMVDYYFNEAELDFIQKSYGNPMLFMASFGLKFYNDDDCEEARSIVRAFMAPED